MKKISLAVATGVVVMSLAVSTAFAWTYGLTGSGKCQPDGSYLITWNVNNSTESEALQITSSSNTQVLPVGTLIPAYQNKAFTQSTDGTKPGVYKLSLSGHWTSDTTNLKRYATVTNQAACAQPEVPVTPPAGGRGGGTTEVVTTTTPAPQVVVPAGPVNAGNGGAKTLSLSALAGLIGSASVLGFGIRRLSKKAV